MEINKLNYPKKIKHHNLAKRPYRQKWFIQVLMFLVAALMRAGKKRKVVKIDMDGLKKEPYLLICNHMQFFDFAVSVGATMPRKTNHAVAIDAFDRLKGWLLYLAGCTPKRKFLNEVSTVRNILHCLKKYKSIVTVYAEARYTQIGTNAVLPESMGKMIKLAKVPVAVMLYNGHHLLRPTWGDQKTRKEVPVLATMKKILTAEQAAEMSVEEINALIRKEFVYDEYKYWRETGFKITYPNRAAGIHNVLYKCPECNAEYEMTSGGAELKCGKCKAAWELTEGGELVCKTGETRFNHVPDWCEWERGEVRKEIEAGTYGITDNPEGIAQPHGKYAIKLGVTEVVHDINGFNMKGHYNGEDFHVVKLPQENYSIQTEFTFPRMKGRHTVGISTDDDTFYFFPTRDGILQKLYFGVEELYKYKLRTDTN